MRGGLRGLSSRVGVGGGQEEGREGHRRCAGMADTTSRQDEAEAERVQTLRDDEGARSWPAKMRADDHMGGIDLEVERHSCFLNPVHSLVPAKLVRALLLHKTEVSDREPVTNEHEEPLRRLDKGNTNLE